MKHNGILLIDKPEGVSSFKVLGPVKRLLGTPKIGHTGTLDPFASGLMVVLIGRYTKLARLFEGLDKTYQAEVLWGVRTDTLDREGTVLEEKEPPSREALEEAIPRFVGVLEQVPPRYSAVHIQGKRAYQLSREGKSFDMPSREVEIKNLSLDWFHSPRSGLTVSCSKGTYIRSLVRDLGEGAGSCGHAAGLRRLRVGDFRVEQAWNPRELPGNPPLLTLTDVLDKIPGLRSIPVRGEAVDPLRQGVPPRSRFFQAPPPPGLYAAVYENRALAVIDWDGSHGKYAPLLEPAE